MIVMKKNLLFKLVLFAIPVAGIFLLNSFSTGNFASGFTGSPGDGGITCVSCHPAGSDYGAMPSITTTIPPEGYTLGETYQITVSVTSSTTRHGFQITAENATNSKVGTWATTDATTQVRNGGDNVSHTSFGNSSWVMDWTAPVTDEGTITFYTAVNAASNADDGIVNDQIVTTSSVHNINVLSTEDIIFSDLKLYPNPTVENLRLNLPSTIVSADVTAYNHLGQQMLKATVDHTNNTLDVSHFQNGIYMLAIHADGKKTTKSFIKR